MIWGIVCLSNSTSIGDMIKRLNVSLSWFLRFWPTNLSFFYKLTKIWNFSIFGHIFKICDLPRLNLPHLKDLDQEFWPLWTQYGTRSKGFDIIGQSKCTHFFYSDIRYLHCINLRNVKEKFILFVFSYFSTKRTEKMKKTFLLNKLTPRGAILLGPPCT